MAGANLMIYVTHVDDSIEGFQSPYLYFWGMSCDHSRRTLMKSYLKSLKSQLEITHPPSDLNQLSSNQICCVYMNHQWHRATIPELKLSRNGTIEVLCIDSGVTYFAPLTSIQTLDTVLPESEVENIKNWPALSQKFILADVCAPCLPGSSRRQWNTAAMRFLKRHVENHTWKASSMDFHGECEILRLFYPNDTILAANLLERKLCEATQTCLDALAMHENSASDSLKFSSNPCKRFLVQTEIEDNDEQNLPKKIRTISQLDSSQEDPSLTILLNSEVLFITTGISCLNISEDVLSGMLVDTQEIPSVLNTFDLPLSVQTTKTRVHKTHASEWKTVQKIIESARVSIHPQCLTSEPPPNKIVIRKRIIREIRERRLENNQSLGAIPKRSKDSNGAYMRRQSKRTSLMTSQNLVFSNQIISTRAVASFANSPVEFWIHLEPDTAFSLSERINQHQIDSFAHEKFRAFVNKPCLAPFTDGKWCRARILATNKNSTTVQYLDYGNICIVSTSALRKLPVDLIEPPAVAYKCVVDGAEHFSNNIAEAFRNLVVQLNSFTVHCLKVVDDVLHVRLYSSDGVDLVEKLCVDHILGGVPVDELPSYLPMMFRANGNYPKRNRFQVDEIPIMNLKFASGQLISSDAVARYIKLSKEVCIQLNPAAVRRLMEEIALSDILHFSELEPLAGVCCLCLFREDGNWYRVIVNSIERDQVCVTFVDYGNSSKVNQNDLLILPPHLTQQPRMALKCTPRGIGLKPVSATPRADNSLSLISKSVDSSVLITSQTSSRLNVQSLEFSSILNFELCLTERNLSDPSAVCEVEMDSPTNRICPDVEEDLIKQFTVKMDILVIDDDDSISDPVENTDLELVTMDF